MYPYPARKDHDALVIAAVVLIAILVLPTVMAGLMYLMVVGVDSGGPLPSPTAFLDVEGNGTEGIGLYVLGPSFEVPLSEVMVIVHGPREQDLMFLASEPVEAGFYTGFSDTQSYTYVDTDAGRTLSAYDRIEVRPTSGPLYNGLYIVRLVHAPTGDTVATATVTVP